MKKIPFTIAFLWAGILLCLPAAAQVQTFQDYREILELAERNSPLLQAARLEMQAEIKANHTDLVPSNPEFLYKHLWTADQTATPRSDFEVSQSFDFPSVYVYKTRSAKMADSAAVYAFQNFRAETLMEVQNICMEIIYINALFHYSFDRRLHAAEEFSAMVDAQLEQGEASIIERNKAHLSLLELDKEQAVLQARRAELSAQLKRYTGSEVDLVQTWFPEIILPATFDEFFAEVLAKNPQIKEQQSLVLAAENQRKAQANASLPSFTVGYAGEDVFGTDKTATFHGLSVGLSVPLWENKNKVKQARLQSQAVQSRALDVQLQLRSELEGLYNNIMQLHPLVMEYRRQIDQYATLPYLEKAMQAGEISILQYIEEFRDFFDIADAYLQTELSFALAYTRLLYLSGL